MGWRRIRRTKRKREEGKVGIAIRRWGRKREGVSKEVGGDGSRRKKRIGRMRKGREDGRLEGKEVRTGREK